MTLFGMTIDQEHIWLTVGFAGQAMFFMRFLVQWIASEKRGEMVIPIAFWYFSLLGAAILLAYVIWRQDPVLILGQSTGLLIYSRNLYFVHKKAAENKKKAAGQGTPSM